MKYTLDQLELIATLFKIQFGDKTLEEIFPSTKHTNHQGTIGELTIDHTDGDVNFVIDHCIAAYFSSSNYIFYVLAINETDTYFTQIENVVKMLNFEDKV